MKSGIYRITCLINGKIYIGSAINLKERWNSHYSKLNLNQHENRHLQATWNKYGKEYFDFDIIKYCSIEELIEREQYYIDYMKPQFNICKTAGSRLGIKHTEESKKKISERQIGTQQSFETKMKRGLSMINNKNNENRKVTSYIRYFSIEEIKEIRSSKLYQRELANKYGVSRETIWKILHFKTYKEIK